METDLKLRTKTFALRVMKLASLVPQRFETKHILAQVLRSASSVAANYRAARRARSDADFIAKLAIVEEEADESLFWLEMLEEGSHMLNVPLAPDWVQELKFLQDEANQLVAIIVASKKTARSRV